MIRILIVDSHPVFRLGLTSVLAQHPDLQLVGSVPALSDLLSPPTEEPPDIIVTDPFLAAGDGNGHIEAIQSRYPESRIFVLTGSDNEESFSRAINAGVKGYLPKTVGTGELIHSIYLVASDTAAVFTPSSAKALGAGRNVNKTQGVNVSGLSRREGEVLSLVAQGASNKEIAAHYFVSETTVKAHLGNILEKLHVKNRAQAVAIAMERGLIHPSPADGEETDELIPTSGTARSLAMTR
jgi:DNA-binding NarL/FixJ family response regulator